MPVVATGGLVTDLVVCVSDLGVYSASSQPRRRFTVTPLCKETFIVVACGRVVQGRGDFTL